MADRSAERVLEEIGLQGLIGNFNGQKIGFRMLLSLSDNELSRLGVTTIGDRVRLREKVREVTQQGTATGSESVSMTQQQDSTVNRTVGDLRGIHLARRERQLLFSSHSGKSSRKRNAEGKHRPWTMTAVCLSDKNCLKVPTADVKETLQKAGLGCKKIQFDSEENLMEKICSNERDKNNDIIGFPQLKKCGGFELLRCEANSRKLRIIDCPWTVKSLKKFLGTQTKVYIRPIQMNLSTDAVTEDTVDDEMKEPCLNCGMMVLVKNLRSHCIESCQGTSIEETHAKNDSFIEENKTSTELTNFVIETVYVTNDVTNEISVTQGDGPQIDVQLTQGDGPQIDVQLTQGDGPQIDVQLTQGDGPQIGGSSDLDTVETIVNNAIEHLVNEKIDNPVEMLRYLQLVLITGRKLDIDATDDTISSSGETNFINIDRLNIIETAFDEVKAIVNPRLTLEVQFYDEMAVDYGGPRKEFFQLVLAAIKEKYFDNGLREHMKEDYITIGKIFSLSILQNGKIPVFINDFEEQIFSTAETNSGCIRNLRTGMDWLGMYTVGVTLPVFRHLLRPTSTSLTVRLLTHLLRPSFSDTGANSRVHESKVYAAFARYMREAAGGRRGTVTLHHILMFATGAEQEPALGFSLHPTIQFVEVSNSFVPTANTCANTMNLPRPTTDTPLPPDETLFNMYDYAFANTYFGLI